MKQRSSEWFKVRAGKITGSRFSRAMARKDTQKYKDLIDELLAERLSGRSQDSGFINQAMQWGMDHEDLARSWYSEKYSKNVQQAGFIEHPKYDFVGVSPDGLVGRTGLVEIKCPQLHNFKDVKETNIVPSRYRWQIQGQLWVCQRKWTDFVCFYPPNNGVVIRQESNANDFLMLEERCIEINSEVNRKLLARSSRKNKDISEKKIPRVDKTHTLISRNYESDVAHQSQNLTPHNSLSTTNYHNHNSNNTAYRYQQPKKTFGTQFVDTIIGIFEAAISIIKLLFFAFLFISAISVISDII